MNSEPEGGGGTGGKNNLGGKPTEGHWRSQRKVRFGEGGWDLNFRGKGNQGKKTK